MEPNENDENVAPPYHPSMLPTSTSTSSSSAGRVNFNTTVTCCHFCPKKPSFADASQHLMHQESLHGHLVELYKQQGLQCDMCYLVFASKTSLANHNRFYHGIIKSKDSFQCQLCSKSYSHVRSLKRHEREVHEARPSSISSGIGVGDVSKDDTISSSCSSPPPLLPPKSASFSSANKHQNSAGDVIEPINRANSNNVFTFNQFVDNHPQQQEFYRSASAFPHQQQAVYVAPPLQPQQQQTPPAFWPGANLPETVPPAVVAVPMVPPSVLPDPPPIVQQPAVAAVYNDFSYQQNAQQPYPTPQQFLLQQQFQQQGQFIGQQQQNYMGYEAYYAAQQYGNVAPFYQQQPAFTMNPYSQQDAAKLIQDEYLTGTNSKKEAFEVRVVHVSKPKLVPTSKDIEITSKTVFLFEDIEGAGLTVIFALFVQETKDSAYVLNYGPPACVNGLEDAFHSEVFGQFLLGFLRHCPAHLVKRVFVPKPSAIVRHDIFPSFGADQIQLNDDWWLSVFRDARRLSVISGVTDKQTADEAGPAGYDLKMIIPKGSSSTSLSANQDDSCSDGSGGYQGPDYLATASMFYRDCQMRQRDFATLQNAVVSTWLILQDCCASMPMTTGGVVKPQFL